MMQFPHLIDDNHNIGVIEGDVELSYAQLNQRINLLARGLLADSNDLNQQRIALFMPAGIDYVVTLLAVWRAGGIAVPLNVASAVGELEHYLACAGVTRLIADKRYHESLAALCQSMNIELLGVADINTDSPLTTAMPQLTAERPAMMLFTSGTTSKPKGVLSSHKNIQSQINSLLKAWAWSDADVIPLFLPVHHIHGIVNVLCCAVAAGARVQLFDHFDIKQITQQIALQRYSVFMAVPTIYVKLLQYFETIDAQQKQAICDGFKAMRLNICGSAACPVKLFDQWQQLTSQVLLERYGMTEIGMGLSNPYQGERRAGCVGQPLPGIEVALFDENDQQISAAACAGEIRVKGDNVFVQYWNNPSATAASFKDGWFCTGDVAVIEKGYYRIMGRASIDIIKSGGYKLSALEIEGALLMHHDIEEVAVIGVEDQTWGERVVAFVVLKDHRTLAYGDLKRWCADKMSAYKIPKTLKVVDSLPRNAMGKVTKPVLKKWLD